MIIGIIPNKNDGWILEANLKIFSKICNKIIIGFDNCTDNSENIVKKFNNTVIIKNSKTYIAPDNHNRRQALLEKAREITKNPIIIAVDADEIFSEEILNEENLQIIKNLDYETVLEVKFRELWFSPFVYRSEKKSVWAGRLMSCIWRDNGLDYPFNNWHEVRVPEIKKKKILNVDLIHFARVLPLNYWSRMRFYIASDVYLSKKNSIKTNYHYSVVHSQKDMILNPIEKHWFPSLSKDFFFNIQKNDSHINWFNDEVLDYLLNDNRSCLKLADIWDFDWIKYYKIRKNKEPDKFIIKKLKDRRNNLQKKIAYYIRVNNSYPVYSIYFYINLVKIFLINIKIYNLIRHLFFK